MLWQVHKKFQKFENPEIFDQFVAKTSWMINFLLLGYISDIVGVAVPRIFSLKFKSSQLILIVFPENLFSSSCDSLISVFVFVGNYSSLHSMITMWFSSHTLEMNLN